MKEQNQEYYLQNQPIQNHYQKIAENYDDLWTYSPKFLKFIAQNIIEKLNLQFTDKLVDLGCGTGLFTKAIHNQIQLKNPIICVDSSAKMLEQIPSNDIYQPLLMDAINLGASHFGKKRKRPSRVAIANNDET